MYDLFTKIIYTGINHSLTPARVRKIKLLNRLLIAGLILSAFFSVMNIVRDLPLLVLFQIVSLFVYSFCIFMNSRGKYQISLYLGVLWTYINLGIEFLHLGAGTGLAFLQ